MSTSVTFHSQDAMPSNIQAYESFLSLLMHREWIDSRSTLGTRLLKSQKFIVRQCVLKTFLHNFCHRDVKTLSFTSLSPPRPTILSNMGSQGCLYAKLQKGRRA